MGLVREVVDGARPIDWDAASSDYADWRPGPPASYYSRLSDLGVGTPGQRILDVGTGPGAVARGFARRGAKVWGIDVSAGALRSARRLASQARLRVGLARAQAERIPFPGEAFDAVVANQVWHFLDTPRALEEARRILVPGGRLVVSDFFWLPRLEPLARRTEALVLEFNPDWSGADWDGDVPAIPPWVAGRVTGCDRFVYDEPIEFTAESWRGRLRACRAIGAALAPEAVRRFDEALVDLLARFTAERFAILHRIHGHVLHFDFDG